MEMENRNDVDAVGALHEIHGIRKSCNQRTLHSPADGRKLVRIRLHPVDGVVERGRELLAQRLVLLRVPRVSNDDVRLRRELDDQLDHNGLRAG